MAINKAEFSLRALERIKTAQDFWHNWRTEARDDFAFISGKQWLTEDEAILQEQKRPPVTFNYSEKMIDAVVGAEVTNRQEATYHPRGVEDAPLAEVWNNAAKWARDEGNAEDEESDAFRDMLICGMGWTQTRMSYDEEPDGLIATDRIDPLEMWYDPAACKPGITDRRYAFRKWWIDEREAKREWPTAMFPSVAEDSSSMGVITRGHRYEDGEGDDQDKHKGQVEIIQYECVEQEPVYRVALGEEIRTIEAAAFKQFQAQFDEANIQYVKQTKRIYYRAYFAGDTLLEVALSPCQAGFTFQAITGKRDRNKNCFYGLTRVMKDPQRWANKWLSQIMHIINSNAKGGLLAEINAFVDPVKAQDEWAQPNSVTMLNEGGLDKVREKGQTPFPSGLDRLMQFALGSLPMVTGINLEALGLANREQAGVLEQQRKQAAYGLLSPLFDSLRRYRKESGRVLLYFIHEYISDGRLIRIGGPESQQFMPLTKQPNAPRYDIIVDQAPNAPNAKDETWQTLQTLLPAMLKAGMPLPPDLLDYAPIPSALAVKWKQFADQAKQPDPRMQQLMQQMQQLQQENEALKQQQVSKQAELMQKAQQAQAELQLKQQVAEAEQKLKRDQAIADYELEQEKQRQEIALERMKMHSDMQNSNKKLFNDLKFKTFTALTSGTSEEGAPRSISVNLEASALSQAVEVMAKSSEGLAEVAQQNSEAVTQALKGLAEILQRPRKLIEDASGKPIGTGTE